MLLLLETQTSRIQEGDILCFTKGYGHEGVLIMLLFFFFVAFLRQLQFALFAAARPGRLQVPRHYPRPLHA